MDNFLVFKNDKQKENQPDYRVNTNKDGVWEEWGACWKKTGKDGSTFLSCSKSKPQEEKGVETKGEPIDSF